MNELNDYGVFVGDFYVLNYYDTLAFFRVSKTTEKTVFLVELGTKRYEGGEIFLNGYKARKKPLIITENNTYTKTTYEVEPNEDLSLPIEIDYNTPIYRKTLLERKNPVIGVYFATKILDPNQIWSPLIEEEINGKA